MKTTFILAGLLAYSQGATMQSLESAVTEAAASQSTARSNSWFSSWWSTSQEPANTGSTMNTEISTTQAATSETGATSSWATYNPLSYFWWSTKTQEEKSDDGKKQIIRHKRGEVDQSLQSQKETLEAFFSRGNYKISPNAERIIRVRSMISSARSATEQRFDSLAEQVAYRARMMMGERLNDADLVAEHRIAQVAQDSMAEELRVAKKKQKRKNKIDAFQQTIQAGKKGDVMADLQNALRMRRITYDTQYSIEGSKALPAPEKTIEKPKAPAKVVIEKGTIPTPPPMKKTENTPKAIKRKSGPKKTTAARSETSNSAPANLMAELKSKIGRRKKGDKKSKK